MLLFLINVVVGVALGLARRSEHQNVPTHSSELNYHDQSLQPGESEGGD
jgi:hypothetical protein